jgi:hypothetical protein
MEPKSQYIKRFHAHTEMCGLFSEYSQRQEVAEAAFAAKWQEACATVRTLDGEEFFIE